MSSISVIVPVFNAEYSLNECLDSILSQSFSDIECLLIDDGSTDYSGRICDEYSELDPRVRVFHKENAGLCSARNLGLDNAVSDWVFFCDADDRLPFDSLKILFENTENSDYVIGGYSSICSVNQYIPEKYLWSENSGGNYIENQIIRPYFITAWGKLYRRKIVCSLRFDEHFTVSEDLDFNWRYLLLVNRVSFVNEVVYHYFDDSAPGK